MAISATAGVPRQHRLDQDTTLRLPGPCRSWCAGHIPTDDIDNPVHISADAPMTATSPCGLESTELYVSIEQGPGQPAGVRLQGAGDAPMTADQALHLAGLLILAARRAMDR